MLACDAKNRHASLTLQSMFFFDFLAFFVFRFCLPFWGVSLSFPRILGVPRGNPSLFSGFPLLFFFKKRKKGLECQGKIARKKEIPLISYFRAFFFSILCVGPISGPIPFPILGRSPQSIWGRRPNLGLDPILGPSRFAMCFVLQNFERCKMLAIRTPAAVWPAMQAPLICQIASDVGRAMRAT